MAERDDRTAVAAIEQMKYAYFRHLDLKEFDALGELLTEDCTAAYEGGHHSYEGRAAIVEFLATSLGDPGVVSMHHGHHPEITVEREDLARGVWYLQDRVVIPRADLEIGGTALYEDVYVRRDGRWRIAHTGYHRIFEERRRHRTLELMSFSSRFEGG
jgi:hypothetical protein